jgi:hypothetical protein
MADDPYANDPFYRNPPLAPPATSTTVTPTTVPQDTTTTTYDPRFAAYSEIVQRWQQGRLEGDELTDFNMLRSSPRAAEWNQRLGIPATDEGTTTTTLPPSQAPAPAAAADQGFLGGLAARGREVMPSMVETSPEGTITPRTGPDAAAEALWGAARLPGAVLAQGVQSGAKALGLGTPEQQRTAGDATQTAYDVATSYMIARRFPLISQAIAIPRALLRIPGMVRRLDDLERQAAASRYQARTITRIPPPTEGGPPPGTTIH